MTTWSNSVNKYIDDIDPTFNIQNNYSCRKLLSKINPIVKLKIIHALDNGQCKADVAKEYRLHPKTIVYIHKQKIDIIKQYSEQYNFLVQTRGMNLDQSLLYWLRLQIKNENIVDLNQLRRKAQEINNDLREKFLSLDDWLSNFQERHNIFVYNSVTECSLEAKQDWVNILSNLGGNNVFFGSISALSYSLDFNTFNSGDNFDNYMSLLMLVNATGSEKCQLAVVGNEPFYADNNVKSLPLDYYYNDHPQINQSVIESYLRRWDDELDLKGSHIFLILNIPDHIIHELNLRNIKLISDRSKDFVDYISKKVSSCFKHYYRRLHINQSVCLENFQLSLLDYFHMMSMAWHNVPDKYISKLCNPENDGSLHFKNEGYCSNLSLAAWCKTNEVPVEIELCSKALEDYVYCDEAQPSTNWNTINRSTPYINELLLQRDSPPNSSMEAFQAMKRLVSYLQGEGANSYIIKHSKYLEDHLEYGALMQMHEIVAIHANEVPE